MILGKIYKEGNFQMKYTPMIEQYLKIKKDYQDMFLFY